MDWFQYFGDSDNPSVDNLTSLLLEMYFLGQWLWVGLLDQGVAVASPSLSPSPPLFPTSALPPPLLHLPFPFLVLSMGLIYFAPLSPPGPSESHQQDVGLNFHQ